MEIAHVQEVIGVATKKDGSELRGQGKRGPWVMYSCILDNGIKLNLFGPVKAGDVVYDLAQNEYKQWQGKVKAAGSSIAPNSSVPDMSQPTQAQLMEAMRKLYAHLDERFEKIEQEIAAIGLDIEAKKLQDVHETRDAGSGSNREYDDINEDIRNGEPDNGPLPF